MGTAVESDAPLRRSGAASFQLLQTWHLLSLDAPSVAALWSVFFARAMRIHLPWHAPALLALGTWLIYITDRILDGVRATPASRLHRRHLFHREHWPAFLVAGLGAAAALLWLICTRMSAGTRREDTVLFAAAMLYLLLVHRGRPKAWLPKELAVGLVFAAATAVPAWSRLSSGRPQLLPAILLFATLCWLNCVAIECWESSPLLRSADATPEGTHRSTRWMAHHLSGTGSLVAGLGVAEAAIFAVGPLHAGGPTCLGLAVANAAILIVLLDRHRGRLAPIELRVGADLALLTPLAFLPFVSW